MGGVVLELRRAARPRRDDVVLPDVVLARIERHALGVAAHRDALLAAGQHLKRGLLLYGPPGTGKTHTTRYLLGQMTGYTRLVLTGRALLAIGSVTELARDLQPAVVVLEDVDLVAEDRSIGPAVKPGAVRPARRDGRRGARRRPAVPAHHQPGRPAGAGAGRPPGPGRRRGRDRPAGRRRPASGCSPCTAGACPLALTDADVAAAVERTDGVTASFLKELIRRSVLESLHDDPRGRLTAVTGAHLTRALDDLLDTAQGVTRTLLGVGVDPATLPAGGALAMSPARMMVQRRTGVIRAYRG